MRTQDFVGIYAVVLTLTARHVLSECPPDSAKRAQACFTDLARGVATVDDSNDRVNGNDNDHDHDSVADQQQSQDSTPGSGTMPLDYRKIREYCEEHGHMVRFVRCVENLSAQCPELPPEGALHQLINPERVRTSVPRLCSNVDKVETHSVCMNREMNRRTPCKDRAYDIIKSGLAMTTRNTTAMFIVQCRFFSVIAECQRFSLSEKCGQGLGDLHADFLLSFVPNVCAAHEAADLQGAGQGHPFADLDGTKGSDILNDVRRGEKKDPEDDWKGQGHSEATIGKSQGQGESNDLDEEKPRWTSTRERNEGLMAESKARQTPETMREISEGTETPRKSHKEVIFTSPSGILSQNATETGKRSPAMPRSPESSVNFEEKNKATSKETKRPTSKMSSSVILPTKDAPSSGKASDRPQGRALFLAKCLIMSLHTLLIVR